MEKDTSKEIVDNTKVAILEGIEYKLKEIEGSEEIYFHDIVSENVDANCPQDRMEALDLIDYTGNEEYADPGIIDHSSIDRVLVTTAYECLHQEIFNDDFFQYLQDELNNEEVDRDKASEILNKISEYKRDKGYSKVEYVDNANQIWIKNVGVLSKDDFLPPAFSDNQVIDLSGSTIKIFTSNKTINQNAIVLENTDRDEFRVYLMDKDKGLDIRDLFKWTPKSIQEGGGRLDPKLYIHGELKKKFESKKEFIYLINQMANKLTEISMKEN